MSFIKVKDQGSSLDITIEDQFNYQSVVIIQRSINPEIQGLTLQLGQCPILDSEAIIFMYRWHKSGKSLTIVDPPAVFFKILDVLELRNSWKINIINKKDESHGK